MRFVSLVYADPVVPDVRGYPFDESEPLNFYYDTPSWEDAASAARAEVTALQAKRDDVVYRLVSISLDFGDFPWEPVAGPC